MAIPGAPTRRAGSTCVALHASIHKLAGAGLEKTLESPLDRKEIQPIHPKGDQFWVFIGRIYVEAETLILWPPDVKN